MHTCYTSKFHFPYGVAILKPSSIFRNWAILVKFMTSMSLGYLEDLPQNRLKHQLAPTPNSSLIKRIRIHHDSKKLGETTNKNKLHQTNAVFLVKLTGIFLKSTSGKLEC